MQKISARALLAGLKEIPEGEDTQVTTVVTDSRRLLPGLPNHRLNTLCDHLGISTADALALGDTYNDVQMLEAVGHSYVVANAGEHMRAHARFMAPSNNERGVARVIEALLAAKAR